MVKEAIQIYLRVRPTETKFIRGEFEISEENGIDKINLKVPNEIDNYLSSNNRKDNYGFRFSKVFDQDSLQEEVFEKVALPVINNFLRGYNGTVFAYGQTGSGKTYTMTGGAERYSDRGIIPRSLSYIFDQCTKNKTTENSVFVSYLEIYNESGYDLLDTKHETAQKLEDLNKVTLYEDQDSNISLKNLSIHPSINEEEALNLLFIGDTNRMVAETPMNQASTRSHCIFTVHLTVRQVDSAVITRSKLHLVDLAGSERVSKTGVNGTLLNEAKYINLSLHYLEQVIVALAEKNRTHIPYRNSMMTSVLRDSLGGNCMTSMIATISAEKRNIMESISTCRFSQRVALIKNEAILNEAVDPQLIIKQLRGQIDDLRIQLQLNDQSEDWQKGELSEEVIGRCRNDVLSFIEDNSTEMSRDLYKDVRKINLAFDIMKELYQNMKKRLHDNNQTTKNVPQLPTIIVPHNPIVTKEVNQLRDIITQRDNEINILVSLLKKAKQNIADKGADEASSRNVKGVTFVKENNGAASVERVQSPSSGQMSRDESLYDSTNNIKQRILGDLSIGREEAFEVFKKDYYNRSKILEQKEELQSKYAEAKELGQVLNDAREVTNKIKADIGKLRIRQAITADPSRVNSEVSLIMSQEEVTLRGRMEEEKMRYKDAYLKLKHLKTIIEHQQHLLETSKVKMMKEFEQWWYEQVQNLKEAKEKQAQVNYTQPPSTRYPTMQVGRIISSHSNSQIQSNRSNDIPLTGDPKVDADITRFIAARNKLRQ